MVNAWEACTLSPNLAQRTRKGGLHLWGLDPLLVFNLSCPALKTLVNWWCEDRVPHYLALSTDQLSFTCNWAIVILTGWQCPQRWPSLFLSFPASTSSVTSKKSEKLVQLTDPSKITVDETSYHGPHVSLPLTLLTIRNIIEHYKANKVSIES